MRRVDRTSYATNRASSALSVAALLERHQSEMPIASATDVPIEINVATTPTGTHRINVRLNLPPAARPRRFGTLSALHSWPHVDALNGKPS